MEMLDKFSERLHALRKERGLSYKELAEQLNSHASDGALFRWENGYVKPRLDYVILLADFYGVSLDYIVGRSNKRKG
ncbi:MAG: helix-turn-helix transcriptional regulator [Lachnospiraceae bacterium]|nr:helix-turn-helix transcriptional regulator [Lachnospiraceae bacterium]